MSTTAFDRIADTLAGAGLPVQHRREGELRTRCPGHDGQSADSLSVRAIEGQALVHCFGGCDTPKVMAAAGLTMRDLYDEPGGARYEYADAQGTILRSVSRRHNGLEPKASYRQVGKATKGTSTLYRLPQVLEAVAAGTPVYLVEGEKDVHALEALGVVATTSPQGASNWASVDSTPLHGAHVILVPDLDEPGARYAAAVRASLVGHAASLGEMRPAVGKDAADHVAAGFGLAELVPADATVDEPAADAGPLRGTVVTMADVTAERVQWLWPNRFPISKLIVVDGDPSVGKSTLMTDIAARITTGADWPDGAPGGPPRDVLLMSAEDGLADTVLPRLEAAGADLNRVHALTDVRVSDEEGVMRNIPPSLPRDIPIIEAIIRQHGVRLLVVDVLMAYLTSKANSSSDQDMRGVLHLLSAMAERTSCSIILLRHLNKSGGGNALYRGGGSIGIIGAARAAFIVARDPEDNDRRIVAVSKLNIAKEPASLAYRLVDAPDHGCARVVWEEGTNNLTAADLLTAPADEEEREERNEVGTWLREYLMENAMEAPAGEVFKAARVHGFQQHVVQRARKKAGVSTKKSGMSGSWLWVLDPAATEGDTEGDEDDGPEKASPSSPSPSPSEWGAVDNVVDKRQPPMPRPRPRILEDPAREVMRLKGAAALAEHGRGTLTGRAS